MRKSTNALAVSMSVPALWMAAAVSAAPAEGPPSAAPKVATATPDTARQPVAQHWTARRGVAAVTLDLDVLAGAGVDVGETYANVVDLGGAAACQLIIRRGSTLTFSVVDGSVQQVREGQILTAGDVVLNTPEGQLILSNPVIAPVGDDPMSALWKAESPRSRTALLLRRVKAGFDQSSRTLTIRSPDVRIAPDTAAALGDPGLADLNLGGVVVRASTDWTGGARPHTLAAPDRPRPGAANDLRLDGCDMYYCQLYGLYMPNGAREGDIVGLSVATTAWNLGNEDCMWFPIPNEEHPFIVMNLYRLKDDRFEMVGGSHIKHGFYALGSHQCGGPACTYESGHSQGNWLGQNCTDTYSAPLNAVQSGMGPKYEVNPWTGYWYYPGSHMDGSHTHDNIQHRLQVHDVDLLPESNPDATYYSESFYCMLDDVDAISSAAWKEVSVNYYPDSQYYSFNMSPSIDPPETGFAIDAWPDARQTILAQEVPVQEFVSPDGRCVLGAKVTVVSPGVWHYEYALLNIDMDRQVGSFSVPLAPGTTVTNIGFHAPHNHDEPFNTVDPDAVPIDNAAWVPAVTSDAITWTTTSNPLRWYTLYNFRFDANVPPITTRITLGLFRPGTPAEVTGFTDGPSLDCIGDIDGDGDVGVNDFLALIGAWGFNPGHPADLDFDGYVGVTDFLTLLARWGPCPE